MVVGTFGMRQKHAISLYSNKTYQLFREEVHKASDYNVIQVKAGTEEIKVRMVLSITIPYL